MRTEFIINSLYGIRDEAVFFAEVKKIFSDYRAKAFSFFNMSWLDPVSNSYKEIPSLNYWYSSASSAWCQRYAEKNYTYVDPVFAYLLKTRSPFVWDVSFGQTKSENDMMLDAQRHGYGSGMSVPIYGPQGDFSVLTIFADDEISDLQGWANDIILEFEFLASQLNKIIIEKFVAKKEASNINLAAREVECLDWVSQGKTAKDVGMILGISERTVRFHLANIRKKFAVATTAQAIAIYNSRRGLEIGQRV